MLPDYHGGLSNPLEIQKSPDFVILSNPDL